MVFCMWYNWCAVMGVLIKGVVSLAPPPPFPWGVPPPVPATPPPLPLLSWPELSSLCLNAKRDTSYLPGLMLGSGTPKWWKSSWQMFKSKSAP